MMADQKGKDMSYYTMSNKELSQLIRKTLKENGYTSKDVSVRVRAALYDTSVNITVKNPLIRLSEVEKIASKFSEIDYDEHSQEILAGCNVYVHCQYAYGIFKDAEQELVPIAEMVLNNKEKYSGHAIADNGKKTVHIIHYEGIQWTLAEFEKDGSGKSKYRPTYWVRSAGELAIAMWRFKNIGTIYA